MLFSGSTVIVQRTCDYSLLKGNLATFAVCARPGLFSRELVRGQQMVEGAVALPAKPLWSSFSSLLLSRCLRSTRTWGFPELTSWFSFLVLLVQICVSWVGQAAVTVPCQAVGAGAGSQGVGSASQLCSVLRGSSFTWGSPPKGERLFSDPSKRPSRDFSGQIFWSLISCPVSTVIPRCVNQMSSAVHEFV